MTKLDDLAQHVDPGTLETEEQAQNITLMTPQQLYELWEKQQWQAHGIDFSRDRADWDALSGEAKDQAIWGLSSFFIGEERVATQFSGMVMAASDAAETSFLTTQQVDEARHMQLFDRFYQEVVGLDQADITGRLERVREELNEAFVTLFDGALVDADRALARNPDSVEAKVDFVTVYHMVIEGTLALTGQRYITDYFQEQGILPGFVEGFENVSRDEHRHVAYGTWFLQQTAGKDPALAARMQAKLAELLPVAAGVLVPKGMDPFAEWTLLGYSSTEVNEYAFKSLSRRLKAIGVPLFAAEAA